MRMMMTHDDDEDGDVDDVDDGRYRNLPSLYLPACVGRIVDWNDGMMMMIL